MKEQNIFLRMNYKYKGFSFISQFIIQVNRKKFTLFCERISFLGNRVYWSVDMANLLGFELVPGL